MSLSRRDFLNRSAVTGLVLVGSTEMFTASAGAAPGGDPREPGYGPLVDDPAGLLALPAGFSYAIVTRAGSTLLESGESTPGNHDGTGAFARPGGGTVLVNNHELSGTPPFPVPHLEGLTYDPGTPGGCTIVEADRDGNRVREYVGLAGTSTNCAGGVTPWGTWLSCEETETLAGQSGATKDHGYVFEVEPHNRGANRDPQPIKALGRYAHEAAAVDPRRGHIYLTEDAADPNGLLYRWEPPRDYRPGKGGLRRMAADAGILAAMAARDDAGAHVDDLSRATVIGTTYQVSWVPMPDRDARTTPTRAQLSNSEITRGRKLEGAWWGNGGAWIVASFARVESPVPHDGQVWFYDPKRRTLTLKVRFGVNADPSKDGALDGP
ncbi:MAG TPA: alkaline phosphatase PhoX, partial [Pseudonocardiaceae bacterium]|nr:alkaline phosphatase PhoX [Pseudonocardiaceae bacterium]